MSILDIQDELLHLEYPFLLPDHDPEIERYYEFRAIGRSQDALNLYQNRLKFRYPDDAFRTSLMRSYRSRDPAYKILLAEAYRSLGARSLERIKHIIEYIADEADSYNEKDVYSTIKAAENILRVLPRERFEAVAGIERYHRYAQHLNYRIKSTLKASDLVRAYLTESLSVVEDERRRRRDQIIRRKALEQDLLVKADWANYEYQKKYGSGHPLIDLSSVVFSSEDLERIEISKDISRLEDQTLAFCVKYWKYTNDPAFERILFLYSRKYGTKNYDIYMTIRRGQLANNRDDEILASVLSALVTGYYYSIQGDIYLQRNWNRLKASLSQDEKTAELRILDTSAEKPRRKKQKTGKKSIKKKKSRLKAAKSVKTKKAENTKTKDDSKKEIPEARAARKVRQHEAGKQKQKAGDLRSTTMKKSKASKIDNSQGSGKTEKKITVTRHVKNPIKKKGSVSSEFFRQEQMVKPSGSVSDRLQELSGRSYDVYKERFLTKARGAIRKVLGAGKGMFYTIPEEVEDLIYNFLRDHYSDPYMNWEQSEEKRQLDTQGFSINSLDSIIDECYKRLV